MRPWRSRAPGAGGAFLFGAALPRDDTTAVWETIRRGLDTMSGTLLLPVFFVVTGLQVDLSGVGLAGLGVFALIMLVAVGGKGSGAFLAARAHGLPPRSAGALAVLMNTRGLTELVILTVGLQLGVIGADLYGLLILMAVVTTAMAGPLLGALLPVAMKVTSVGPGLVVHREEALDA